MRPEQIDEIDKEINRLINRMEEIKQSPSSPMKENIEDYIQGRIDSLRWAKDNL